MDLKQLRTLAQDAGFVLNPIGELVTSAPTSDATMPLAKFADLATKEQARELRKMRKALRELSDSVLWYLHWMDKSIGPDKTIPHDVSAKLGKAAAFLDRQNDGARRFALDLPITAEGKRKAAEKLASLFSPAN